MCLMIRCSPFLFSLGCVPRQFITNEWARSLEVFKAKLFSLFKGGTAFFCYHHQECPLWLSSYYWFAYSPFYHIYTEFPTIKLPTIKVPNFQWSTLEISFPVCYLPCLSCLNMLSGLYAVVDKMSQRYIKCVCRLRSIILYSHTKHSQQTIYLIKPVSQL